MNRLVPGLVIGALVLSSSAVAAQGGSTLSAVQERGQVVCGVNGGLPGMSVLNEATGVFEGMDADFCRAVAAAALGDPTAVQYTPLTADQRATAIQGGEVDVIFRNTTHTLTRDASWGDFGPVIFYDGQSMMVPVELGITTLEELDGASICVTSGTTTEQNLADQMAWLGLDYTAVVAAEMRRRERIWFIGVWRLLADCWRGSRLPHRAGTTGHSPSRSRRLMTRDYQGPCFRPAGHWSPRGQVGRHLRIKGT